MFQYREKDSSIQKKRFDFKRQLLVRSTYYCQNDGSDNGNTTVKIRNILIFYITISPSISVFVGADR
jgi:hypothetical protein